ncbi:MAG: hypothetical protein RLY16_1203 [Bacteroidota bacterium]
MPAMIYFNYWKEAFINSILSNSSPTPKLAQRMNKPNSIFTHIGTAYPVNFFAIGLNAG